MKGWAILFFAGGVVFLAGPDQLIRSLNQSGSMLGLAPVAVSSDPSDADFWLALGAAMMFTIGFLAALVASDPRRQLPCAYAIVVAKAASSITGLAMYLLKAKSLAYLALFMVDFPIGLMTVILVIAARNSCDGSFRNRAGQ